MLTDPNYKLRYILTACTIEQAKIIVSLRPFKDPEDLRRQLRKRKGVSSAVFSQYQEVMKVRLTTSESLQGFRFGSASYSFIVHINIRATSKSTVS